MKYITSILVISLIMVFSCKPQNSNSSSSDIPDMDENELTRVTMLIDPAPKTYLEDQVNQLIQYALAFDWPVHKTHSGLLYWIRNKGNDKKVHKNDIVLVRYKGNLLNGKVFDESPQSGEPVSFKVSEVIPAWQEALSLIGEDGKIIILAHSDLGYKSQQIGNVIPAYSPLIFEVELIDVQKGE